MLGSLFLLLLNDFVSHDKKREEMIVLGLNDTGMLATGNHEKVRKPELVFEDVKMKKVCVGHKFSILLKSNGEVDSATTKIRGCL